MLTVPARARVSPRTYLTPSLFVQGRKCLARLGWASSDAAPLVPQDPAAILGTALHRVQEQADRGELSGEGGTFEEMARAAFDRAAGEALARAHPLLRARCPRLSDLPRFYLQRARSVEMARDRVRPLLPSQTAGPAGERSASRPLVEQALASSDGLLRGRADCLDIAGERIIDYKSGSGPADGDSISEDERTQLLLYAALAHENGVAVREGCIVRADGHRASCSLPTDAAGTVAKEARSLLTRFNAEVAAGRSPDAMAAPSPSACAFCGFRPLCSVFWQKATLDWATEIGGHAQMIVQDAREVGTPRSRSVLVTGSITGGSVALSAASVRFPRGWIGTSYDPALLAGRQIRLPHVRAEEAEGQMRLQPDRERGLVWLLPQP